MSRRLLSCYVLLLAGLQVLFWTGIPGATGVPDTKEEANTATEQAARAPLLSGTRHLKPLLAVVPPVPSPTQITAASFGENQFLFRRLALRIQNAGDSFGRFTALKNYDYQALYQWWSLLDDLDARSHMMPALASYYYSATQTPKPHIPHVVRYLEEHSDRNPEAKWWWYGQAAYLAQHKIDDNDTALRIAYKLAALPDTVAMPLWTRQLPAFILEKKGQFDQACKLILNIIDHHENLTQGELNFMFYFINERIQAMEHVDPRTIDPRCQALIQKDG